jgi:cell division transport system permease protein
MSLASVIIVIATLVILGFFLLIAVNLELNLNTLKNQPQLEAFCYDMLEEVQVQHIEDSIKNDARIASYHKVTKEEALKKAKDMLGKGSAYLEGYEESIFPVSFIIKLKDNAQSGEVVKMLENTTGIETVTYSQDTIELISKISYWGRFISMFMMIILLLISVFIISNTIKLTVFARRKEINIMKYVGATDWFIRWPFVVEGVIIGMMGAVFAFVLSAYGYNAIEGKFTSDLLSMNTDFLKMMNIRDVWFLLAVSYTAVGVLVGATGSFVSIRKHLRV